MTSNEVNLDPLYLYTKSVVRYSTRNKIRKYIEDKTIDGSYKQKQALKKWNAFSRQIKIGTHEERHLDRKRQYHYNLYGHKNALFGCDLADVFGDERNRIASENSGFKYFFVWINCLTKFVQIYPIKSRKGGEILKAFKKALNSSGIGCSDPITNIQVDMEFLNRNIRKFCKTKCVNIYYSQSDYKMSIVERFIRSFKHLLVLRMETNRTEKWEQFLPDILKQYNDLTIHTAHGMTPKNAEIHPNIAWIRLVEKYNKINKKNLIKPFKFAINSWVRMRRIKTVFRKGYLRRFTAQRYQVYFRRRVPNVNIYYLRDEKKRKLKGSFREQLLTSASKDTVFDFHVLKRDGKKLYVHWDGFGSSDDEWIDSSKVIEKKSSTEKEQSN